MTNNEIVLYAKNADGTGTNYQKCSVVYCER